MKNILKLTSILMFVTITQQSVSMHLLQKAAPKLFAARTAINRFAATRSTSIVAKTNAGVSRIPSLARRLNTQAISPKPQVNTWRNRALGLAGAAGLMGIGIAMQGQKAKAEYYKRTSDCGISRGPKTSGAWKTVFCGGDSIRYQGPNEMQKKLPNAFQTKYSCHCSDLSLGNDTSYSNIERLIESALKYASQDGCSKLTAYISADCPEELERYRRAGAAITKAEGSSGHYATFSKNMLYECGDGAKEAGTGRFCSDLSPADARLK